MDLSSISHRKYFYIRIITIICLVLILIFIWGNSLTDKKISVEISDTVVDIVRNELPNVEEKISDISESQIDLSYLVRKCAHFIEFFLLAICFIIIFLDQRDAIFRVLFFGLLSAVIDETIQLFNDRSSSVADVWLDMLGFSIGIVLTVLVIRLIRKCGEI